jgi:hypothetical protein
MKVFVAGAPRDLEVKHRQLAMDPRCCPLWVFPAHSSDEIAQLSINFGRPALFRDFQQQNAVNPARCH